MRQSRLLHQRAVILVLLLLVVSSYPSLLSSTQYSLSISHINRVEVVDEILDQPQVHQIQDTQSPLDKWATSDSSSFPEPIDGVLKPVTIEQSGYSSTGNVTARTDLSINTQQALPIDTSQNWIASTAEVDVWNLQKLYVVNGTFDDGIPGFTLYPNSSLEAYPFGWSAQSINPDPDQILLVSYEDSGRSYVSVQNQAEVTNNPQHIYTHFAGTSVVWNQTIDITSATTEFLLSFDYLYLQGLLSHTFSGDFSLQVFLDGVVIYSVDLPTLSERGTWFSTGSIPVIANVSSGKASFMIGLVIENTMIVDGDNDYDSNGFPDGATNTQVITVYIDDVSLVSATPPDCETANLGFSVNGSSSSITGALGSGFGVIFNSDYWTVESLDLTLYSNTSVSFDYSARLLNHRFLNSSWTTNTIWEGVKYSIPSGQSGELEMFAYLGFLGSYEELALQFYYPSDWENSTVYDPFSNDVTPSCVVGEGGITVPSTLTDKLGWWRVTCQAPNYANNATIERYDSGASGWVNESIFHSNDIARLSVIIGTASQTPIISDSVHYSWMLPNYSSWYMSSSTGGFGVANSPSVAFGPTNTTAGIWCVSYLWSNGSELAYDCKTFTLHHIAILESVYSDTLDTLVGQPVSIFLRFLDAENGLYIMNDGATVVGNWTSGDVEFAADIVKNWWQADFDTGLLGPGDYTISIVSAAPYFETVPLLITLSIQALTNLNPPTGPLTPLIYGRQYSYDYNYTIDYNGSGIDGALVEVSGEGSEWASIIDEGNGHYNLSITPLGLRDHNLFLTFSKVGYENQTHVFSFLVNKVPMKVNPLTPLRAPEYQELVIEVEIVESDTNNSVSGANVSLNIMTLGASLHMDETGMGTGIYRSSLIMPEAGDISYDATIIVEKENYELTQDFRFALIPTFDANARLFRAIINYSNQIMIIVGVLVAAVAGQKYYSRKNRRKHALARDIKARFDDANNLLGVVVLHKLSGLPIYSKILKSGLEEGMLSAFITAIMHFRAEFDKRRERDDYIIIPISDIVRSVPTENLICAFITVTSASRTQEEKMMNYARAIGMMFDEALSERPMQVVDVRTIKTFEWMFDDFVDGFLLRPYQIGEKKLPKRLRYIKEVVSTSDGVESFLLVNLIRLLETCGIDEDDAYLIVMDAIEQEYIVPIYSNSSFTNGLADVQN
jgi:hypothetical protein